MREASVVQWVTRAEAKERLGRVSERTFVRLAAEGLPRKGEGTAARFPFPDALTWYIARQVRLATEHQGAGTGTADNAALLQRERSARTRLQELNLAERERRLVPIEAYRTELTVTCQALRAAIVSMPNRNAGHVIGLETRPHAIKALQLVAQDLLQTLQTCMAAAPPAADREERVEG